MTERQERALDEIADRPRKLPRATGEALVRKELATRERGSVYSVTDRGRRLRERRIAENEAALLSGKLSKEDRERRERAVAWIDFVGRVSWAGKRYAKTCLSALILEVPAPASGMGWGEDGDDFIADEARRALGAVEDSDVARRQAKATGGEVLATWSVEEASPVQAKEDRRAAVRSAETPDGVADLTEYRKRRSA